MAASFNFYLNFPGNTEEAFNFYKSVFGGEFLTIMRFKDTPGCEGMPAADQSKLMHIALPVGKGSVLMGTDAIDGMGHPLKMGNNVSISLSPESEAEGKKLFDALSAGGSVLVPYDKAFWGATFGMLADKFGVQWMINYDERQPQ